MFEVFVPVVFRFFWVSCVCGFVCLFVVLGEGVFGLVFFNAL